MEVGFRRDAGVSSFNESPVPSTKWPILLKILEVSTLVLSKPKRALAQFKADWKKRRAAGRQACCLRTKLICCFNANLDLQSTQDNGPVVLQF